MKIQFNKLSRLILAKGDPLPAPVDSNVDSMDFNDQTELDKLNQAGNKTISADGQTITVAAPGTPATIPVIGGITQAERDKLAALPSAASLISQRIIATTDTNGNYTWTFSPAFAAPPVLNCEVVSGASTFPHTINIVSCTASQAVFKVYRANALTVSILGVNLFTNPGAVQIHLTAQPA